jgi:acyl carrier protein
MQRDEILKQVTDIFRDIFDDQELVVGDKTSAVDIPEWDSLIQIEILCAHEAHFGLKFGMREVLGMKNVGEMISIIQDRADL